MSPHHHVEAARSKSGISGWAILGSVHDVTAFRVGLAQLQVPSIGCAPPGGGIAGAKAWLTTFNSKPSRPKMIATRLIGVEVDKYPNEPDDKTFTLFPCHRENPISARPVHSN